MVDVMQPKLTPALEARIASYAQKLKVLGHPVRLKLLCLIARQDEPCVSELWTCVQQPQPVVSQHLAALKEKGIVQSEVQGNRRIYSIADPFVRELIRAIDCTVTGTQG